MASPAHYLLTTTQRPRVVAYLLAATLLVSPVLAGPHTLEPVTFVVAVVAALFPFFVNHLGMRWGSGVHGARQWMFADSLMVAVMIAVLGFVPLHCLTLLTMLAVSTLIVAPVLWAAGVVVVALAASVAISQVLPLQAGYAGTELIALLGLGTYFCFIGLQVFREMLANAAKHRTAADQLASVTSLSEKLKSYVASDVVLRGERIERRRLTVFFSDIAGFTEMMEDTDENHAAAILNRYFDMMIDIADEFGGTVDKFIGDGLMVFFGDRQTHGAALDALRCILMAEAMQQATRALSASTQLPLAVRVGINTGYCLVGGFGSTKRRDYTALGSTVNLASRIESAAVPGEILISSETARLTRTWVSLRYRGEFELKGIQRPQVLYRVEEKPDRIDQERHEPRVRLLSKPV